MEKEIWLSKLIEIEKITFSDKYKDYLSYALYCKYGFIIAKEEKEGDIWKGIIYGRYDAYNKNILPAKHAMELWLSSLEGISLEEIY